MTPLTRTRRHRRTVRRGFTISEIVIAASLSLGFALLMSMALVTTSNLAGKSITRASMAADSRALADAASRYLRGAAPPGRCLDPDREQWPLNGCSTVGQRASAFISASGTKAVFYSYGTSTVNVIDSSVLTVPDKVEIATVGDELIITKYAALSPGDPNSFTNPSWVATPEIIRKFRITGTGSVFSYYDASRTRMGATSELTSDELERISLIKFSPRLETIIGGQTRTSGIDVTVPIGWASNSSGLKG